LIKVLLGILRPTVGTAKVLGHDAATEMLKIRSRIGYMPEDDCLPLDVNAAEFLVYAAGLAGLPRDAARQRASDVLTLVGLEEERFRRIGGFSTGMKQRTKLAQAIVHDPELVFLDEPTAGLDPEGREEMLDLISRLGGFGINVLVSSHVLGDIERTCDRVLMLEGGRVLESGELSHFVDEDVVEVETIDDPDEFVRHLLSTGARVESTGVHVRVSTGDGDPFDLVRDALAATATGIRSMGPKSTSLEDVFLGRSES
ncbi:MAG: ABC transporter ATP-binding protein, partial [Actinomycetota bacterium]